MIVKDLESEKCSLRWEYKFCLSICWRNSISRSQYYCHWHGGEDWECKREKLSQTSGESQIYLVEFKNLLIVMKGCSNMQASRKKIELLKYFWMSTWRWTLRCYILRIRRKLWFPNESNLTPDTKSSNTFHQCTICSSEANGVREKALSGAERCSCWFTGPDHVKCILCVILTLTYHIF